MNCQYWIARDADGRLTLYNYRPVLIEADDVVDYDHFGFPGSNVEYTLGNKPIVNSLPENLFPEVTVERSPIPLTVGTI